MYIVELESGVWLASWDGDPGRTIVKENAKKFKTEEQAKLALEGCRAYRPFIKARVLKHDDMR